MKIKGSQSYQCRWILTLSVITLGVYLGLRYLLPLVFPFIIAYFLAWIIRPVTELLFQKLKIPRIIGGAASLLLLVAVFGTSFFMLINILIKQGFAFVKNLPVYLNSITDRIDAVCLRCDKFMGYEIGTVRRFVDENLLHTVNKIKNNLMPEITEHTISITVGMIALIGILLIIFVAAVLIVKDLPEFHEKVSRNPIYKDVHKVTVKLSEAGMAYLRSQLIIMCIVAGICILGLSLIKNSYAVLLGLGIAIMDALPILGSGMIFVPWSIFMLINGKIYIAAILLTTYLLCQIVREVLEPKLIGNRIGIKPLFTLISMYVGLKLFSVAGFFLGPIGLLIIITVYKVVTEKWMMAATEEQSFYDGD